MHRAHNDDDKKHGGKLEENIEDFEEEYILNCNDLRAPEEDRASLMHIMPKAAAKRLYMKKVRKRNQNLSSNFNDLRLRFLTNERIKRFQ